MNTQELKAYLHHQIDESNDESLLLKLFGLLKKQDEKSAGKLWNSLTEAQKNEVLLSYSESENEEELLDIEEIFK